LHKYLIEMLENKFLELGTRFTLKGKEGYIIKYTTNKDIFIIT